ncbi:DnaT-like ssDNA-binding protein [Nitrosomonas sp. Is35]|uniref:DnaT-like ssDNA-binding protein n=1 Tax=Nitrosomonas sp. Is35 TaxID=3080534 RepID=UPI00294B53DB|nr:DnaT-like ssDNA-binding protein [Nitrosomonas sp. Is35]MDV6347474.1 DnaT-like ssDNA-binding protein [Nitrosomonas sp. Is35]
MAIVVEDGTGKSNAQSYLSLADVDSYFAARGIAAWTGANSAKEAALIAATEYIDIRWGDLLKGSLEFPDTQALLFPRLNIYDNEDRALTGIPQRLERATAEYALISLSQSLMPNPTIESSGKIVTEESEETGPIKETKKYQSGYLTKRPYPKADALMACFILGSGTTRVYV